MSRSRLDHGSTLDHVLLRSIELEMVRAPDLRGKERRLRRRLRRRLSGDRCSQTCTFRCREHSFFAPQPAVPVPRSQHSAPNSPQG